MTVLQSYFFTIYYYRENLINTKLSVKSSLLFMKKIHIQKWLFDYYIITVINKVTF